MFRKGLNAELKKLLSPCIYLDFNTLMNMAIITERVMAEEKRDNKRKFLETKARQQDRFQKSRHFGPPVPRPLCSTGPSHKLLALRPPTPSLDGSRVRTP
jgi:hypothetical protein